MIAIRKYQIFTTYSSTIANLNGYSVQAPIQTFRDNKNCTLIWHKRLGHKIFDASRSLIKNKLVVGITVNK